MKRLLMFIIVLVFIVSAGFLAAEPYTAEEQARLDTPEAQELLNSMDDDQAVAEASIDQQTADLLKLIISPTFKHAIKITKIMQLLQQEYFKSIDTEERATKAIQGLLSDLDPYTVYLDSDTLKRMNEDITGEYGGIGVVNDVTDDYALSIFKVFQGSPAEKAGLLAGDKILAVDNDAYEILPVSQRLAKVRGLIGTTVTLTIYRPSIKAAMLVVVTRGKIQTSSVCFKALPNHVGYIHITDFGTKTFDEFVDALRSLYFDFDCRDIVLDLRYNGGGMLETALRLSSLFMSIQHYDAPGTRITVLETKRADGQVLSSYAAKIDDIEILLNKIVVLTNKTSASASEILAGILKDYNLATIIGQTSYGKGSVQSVLDLGDGTALKVTRAKYYLPNGECIDQTGIAPDITINVDTDQVETDRYIGLTKSWYTDGPVLDYKNDPFVIRALAYIATDK